MKIYIVLFFALVFSNNIYSYDNQVENYLKDKENIGIDQSSFAYMLLEAEKDVKNSQDDPQALLRYATLLLSIKNVYGAQVTAQQMALSAYEIDKSTYLPVQLIMMQSYINMLDYVNAAIVAREILDKEDVIINDINFLHAYILSHALSGDIEEGLDALRVDLIYNPSHYGAHAGVIELLKIQGINNPNYKDVYDNEIQKHRKPLKQILQIVGHRMESDMKEYLRTLVRGAS